MRGRFGEIWRFEVGYLLRRPTTWLYAVGLTGFPMLILQGLSDGPQQINAPLTIASATFLVSLVGLFVTASLMGSAATRDHATAMDTLFFTAPLRKWEYLGGRFLGALTVNGILLLGVPLGLLIATQVPYDNPVTYGPFRALAYIQPLLTLTVPTTFAVAALLFSVAALTRHTLPMYLSGIGTCIGYLFAADRMASVKNQVFSSLVDPFGVIPLQRSVQYWTPAERNTELVGLPAPLLWNRLFWLAVGISVLALLHARFRFERSVAGGGGRFFGRRRTTEPGRTPEPLDASPAHATAMMAAARTAGTRDGAAGRQLLAITRSALRDILLSRLFLVIALGAIGVTVGFGIETGAIVFDTSTYPVTHLMAGEVLTIPMRFLMSLLIGLYAGELVWRDRTTGMSAITAAAPVPEWVTLAGNFIALVLMVVVLQAVLMLAGMLVQAFQGYYRFEIGLYVQILFGLTLASYIVFAVLAMAVHVVVDQKALGHLVVVLIFVFTVMAARLFGIRHHLLVYGADSGWVYSDMNRFGPFIGPFVWFKLYWAAWALLIGVVAALFWVRGTPQSFTHRLQLARARFAGRTARAAAVAAALIVTLGGFIFYNTNILNEYRTPATQMEQSAAYERRYKRYENAPQPRVTAIALRVEIYPTRRAVDMRGHYRLVNLAGVPIDSVHVKLDQSIEARSLGFDRPARAVVEDDEQAYRIYALERPLAPGDSMKLEFDLAFQPHGFPNSGINTSVARNGAYFDRRWLPVIGYQATYELSGAEARREAGLSPEPRMASANDAEALRHRSELRDADLVSVDATIGTDEKQIAITPGRLVREWRENGRRYFQYKTDAPLTFGSPFLSAEYAVREDRWHDVALKIFHHPTHTYNLDRLTRSMKASLDYYTTHFGPYQFPELRIVEFPRYASFARAHPHTIAFSEGGSLLTRVESWDIDRPFFVVAHETAHQWWGGQIAGARVQGAGMLTETLAQYSALMVMEKAFGAAYVRRFYDYEMDYYLRGRSGASRPEPPLLRVEDQSHVYYRKGSVVMYTLRERIGEDSVNAALRRFLVKYRGAAPPYPTSLDLYAELRAVTPDSVRGLLRDLFEEVTLWDVRTDSARAEAIGGGKYRVTLDVRASKTRSDSAGMATDVAMDDLVEVGVFAAGPKRGELGDTLYLQQHRVRSGEQRISVIVAREPGRAGIDPYRKLIQRESGDNIVDVRLALVP